MPSQELLVEAILFAAGTRITVDRIMELSKIKEKQVVVDILTALQQKYDGQNSSITLTSMGEEWKLTVKTEFLPIVEKIAPDAELPKSMIETLAIVAWKSPVLQSEIVRIRSTKAYDHIEELLTKGFIMREKSGRSYLIKLTPKFFEYFDISSKAPIEQAVNRMASLPKPQIVPPSEPIVPAPEVVAQQTLVPEKTVRDIKDEHRAAQKDFFTEFDSKLSGVSSRSGKLSDEIKEFLPKPEPVAQQPAQSSDQQSASDVASASPDVKKE